MLYRSFGKLGWPVSEIGYGMWGLAGWTGSDDEETAASLARAVELGCNFFDTAWAYGNGRSERLLGRLVRDQPENVLYVATKVPPKNFKWPSQRGFTLDECFPPDHIREYTHKSLENLDLPSDRPAPVPCLGRCLGGRRTLAASSRGPQAPGIDPCRRRQRESVGASQRSGDLADDPIDAVQVIYNIFDQSPQDELFPLCRELNVAVIARVPFDEGTLTGTLTKESRWPKGDWRNTYFVPENLVRSRRPCRGPPAARSVRT